MNKPYHNDQAHIAEEFHFIDDHITQTARLAFLKINSYKLSQINAAFCMSQEELANIIKSTWDFLVLNWITSSNLPNQLLYPISQCCLHWLILFVAEPGDRQVLNY
jgi:hypothetical protein